MRRFLFEEDFDDPEGRPALPAMEAPPPPEAEESPAEDTAAEREGATEEAEPEPPPPTFTEADIEEARRMGMVAGREEGEKAAREETEKQVANSLQAIQKQMQQVSRSFQQSQQAATTAALDLARAITRRVLPVYARKGGAEEMEQVVKDCLPMLITEPRIIVRVPEDQEADAEERLRPLAEKVGFAGRLVIMGDGSLKPGDGRVEWESGGVERDMARLETEIDAVIQRHVAPEIQDGTA